MQEIFIILIPFYIFSHESRFNEYESDESKLLQLQNEYKLIRKRLEDLEEKGAIDVYAKCIICDMTKRVIRSIARSSEKVREGVQNIMGGKILEHEAKTILKQGISQGISQGEISGRLKTITAIRRLKRNDLVSAISKDTGLSFKEIDELRGML